MSEKRIYKNIMNSMRDKSRKLLAVLLIASTLLSADAITARKAEAGWIPGIWGVWLYAQDLIKLGPETCDFDPHYRFFLWYVAPAPCFARKPWCMPGFKIFGVCVPPKPFTKNWCVNATGCTMTNAFNLFVTLEIKHSDEKIGKSGRLDDRDQFRHPGSLPDWTGRDQCIAGANIPYTQFDPKTGQLLRSGAGKFDETATGYVLGSKPDVSSCMPTINTPKIDTPVDGNLAFSYYQNAGNYPFKTNQDEGTAPKDIYGNSNRYLSTTFFLGGALGCPDSIFANDDAAIKTPTTAEGWRKKAEKCYNYFILERATQPQWSLERPGPATDDPLTEFDPEKSIYNNCQTLMDGENAKKVANGESPNGKGFAPVLQYENRPDMDEADYSPAQILKKDYASLFPGARIPQFSNAIPCIEKKNDGGAIRKTDWDTFNNLLENDYLATAIIEAAFMKKYEGPVLFRRMMSDVDYTSPGVADPNYCPNVEKIISPGNPFSPRDDVKSDPKMKDLIFAPFKYNIFKDDDALDIMKTDRQYSHMTNFYSPKSRIFGIPYGFYYSNWMDPSKMADPVYLGYFALYSKLSGTPDTDTLLDFAKHPEVQCAIVPVDIIEPRRAAFNACMMQRINYNYVTFRRHNFLRFYYKRTMSSWKKPCATRFYEKDTYDDCPVSMSIQQCCRIIVKDVVPLNHLKIRTCEGLRQKRKIIFGYDHIYDASTVQRVERPDQAAIDAAQAKVDELQHQWDDLMNFYWSAPYYPRYNGHTTAAYVCMALKGVGAPPDPRCLTNGAMDLSGNTQPTQTYMDIVATQCTDQASCYSKCYSGRWNGLDCRDLLEGNGSANSNRGKPGLVAFWAELKKALADLDYAKTLRLYDDTDTPIASAGGKFMKVTDKDSYDLAYKENQKLTLIGCDNSEPDEYRFSNYFDFSSWGDFGDELNTKMINTVLNKVQWLSDDLLLKARDASVTAVFNNLTDEMWKFYDQADGAADALIDKAKVWANKVLQAQQNIRDRVDNGNRAWDALHNGSGVTVPRVLVPINDPTLAKNAALFQDYLLARLELAVIEPVTNVVFQAVDVLETKKDEGSKYVQDKLKDGVQLVLDKRLQVFNSAKNKADKMIIDGVMLVRDKARDKIPDLINDLWDKLYSSPAAALVVSSALGEGGAHMPYMRWWDTGTSAGNPVHGGSFINTLGSYDTIIGVGREERDFFDATESIPLTTCPAEVVTTVQVTNPDKAAAQIAWQQALANPSDAATKKAYYDSLPATIPETITTGGCVTMEPNLARIAAAQAAIAPVQAEWDARVANYRSRANEYDDGKSMWEKGCMAIIAVGDAPAPSDCILPTTCGGSDCVVPCRADSSGNHRNDNDCQDMLDRNPGGASGGMMGIWTRLKPLLAELEEAKRERIPRDNRVTTEGYSPNTDLRLKSQQSLTQSSRMGRIGGWAELKAHQMWTTRRHNLVCIGRYEKLFKPGGQEDFVLAKAGANYTSKDNKQWPWPLGWRGYINDPNNEFEKNINSTGLDNAQAGDIIIYTVGNLKRLAYVVGVNQTKPRFVRVQSWDNGKFPTPTGSGLSWGMGVDRTIYKDSVPEDKLSLRIGNSMVSIANMSGDQVAKVGNQPSCEDPSFNACVLGGDNISTWDEVKIYRPSQDTERRRCPMADFTKDEVNLQTSKLDTDSFSYCLNGGYDPPSSYVKGDYKGAGTGAITDTTLCGPGWTECSSTATAAETKCFPGGATCTANVEDLTPVPASTSCTQAEWQAAYDAYSAAVKGTSDTAKAVNEALEKAQDDHAAAQINYNNYYNAKAARLAQLNSDIYAAQSANATSAERVAINAATADLNLAISNLSIKRSAAATAYTNLTNYVNTNKAALQAAEAKLDAAADDENLTPAEQQAKNTATTIHANTSSLQSTYDAAATEADAAQTAVDAARAKLEALPRSGTPAAADPAKVAERDAINAELARLKGLVDSASAAVNAAEASQGSSMQTGNCDPNMIKNNPSLATTCTTGSTAGVPPMSCPWPPANTNATTPATVNAPNSTYNNP